MSESARLFRSFRVKISSRINRVVYKIIVGGKEKGNTTGLDGWENSKVFSSEERFLPSRRNACSRMCSRIRTWIFIFAEAMEVNEKKKEKKKKGEGLLKKSRLRKYFGKVGTTAVFSHPRPLTFSPPPPFPFVFRFSTPISANYPCETFSICATAACTTTSHFNDGDY